MSLRSAAVCTPLFVSFWRSEGGSGSVAMSRRGAGCCIAVRLLVTHVPCSCCNSDALTRLNGYAAETLEVSGPDSLPGIQTLPAEFASTMLRHTCRFSEPPNAIVIRWAAWKSTCVTAGAVLHSDTLDIMPACRHAHPAAQMHFACRRIIGIVIWPVQSWSTCGGPWMRLGQQPASTVHRQPRTVGYELQHTVCA